MKTISSAIILIVTVLQFSTQALAQTPNSSYIIQENDWLSKIAQKAYNDPHLYYRIIEGTNKKAETQADYKKITSANAVKVGQKIWIPAIPSPKNLTGIPKTDCEIRLWYNFQIVAVGVINEKWKQDGVDLKSRAHKAFEMRHEARVNARFMMQNKSDVKTLQERDTKKYGNPDGPTFEYLLKKSTDKGLTEEEAYQFIIDSSSRTDKNYNADCL